MMQIDGKTVLTELSELVDPARAALLVVDMQKDFVEPGHHFDSLGIDLSMYPPMRPRLRALLERARAAGVRVVHVRVSTLPGRQSDSPAQMRFNMRMQARFNRDRPPLTYALVGTPGHAFVDELAPLPGELVVDKCRSSAFQGTSLALLLRSNGIESVLMTGCTTEGCVESTARDALFHDHYVVVVEDCVASDDRAQHEASLLLMRHRFDVATSAEIVALWQEAGSAAPPAPSAAAPAPAALPAPHVPAGA